MKKTVISSKSSLFKIDVSEIWGYKDLLLMLIKRDFVALYKQTILGPLWFVLQPILTTITFYIVFSRIAGLKTAGVPPVLFYMSGIVFWNYFAESFNKISITFKENKDIFGKVYFPRLIVPLSVVSSNLFKLSIQFVLFLAIYTYYIFRGESFGVNSTILLFPVNIICLGLTALGLGMIFSSLTSKYRDLVFLLQFGVQLLMYATPVIYPLSTVGAEYQWILGLNPLAGLLESFKAMFFESYIVDWNYYIYSVIFSIVIFFIGLGVFTRTEKTFIDTV